VGDRFSSKPKSKEYSSITVYLNYYFDIKKEFIVSKNVFYPRPNVDSMIISLSKKNTIIKPIDENKFLNLVRDSFRFKRKTLKNNLYDYDWDKIKAYLIDNNINELVRAEELSLSDYINISNSL
jgi:16S rRNA (adenine1518-N6/adenine1519-N6)-dimethyltransferase